MKKILSAIFTVFSVVFLLFAFTVSSSAAFTTTRCTGPNVNVSTFEAFKNALENFEDGNTVTLKSNITITDDTKDYGINVKNKGVVTVDLNGYTLDVKSAKTKTLFNVTGESKLFFISDVSNSRGVVLFNTKSSNAALVRLNNVKAEFTNINADFTMGKNYSDSNDGSDSYVFYAEKGSRIDSYKGTISNHMMTGNGIGAAESAENVANLTVRIGGNTTVSAKKYCVVIKPELVKYVRFGSCSFKSLRDNKSEFVRIKTSDTAKINNFWSSSDDRSVVYVDNIIQLDTSKKIGAINKDIRADKQCDVLSPDEQFIVLYYAGGHVELCGTCFMSFDDVVEHTMTITYGRDASCTIDGMEYGQLCMTCGYTTAKIIPKTGHSIKYCPAKEVTCGGTGNIAHYACENKNCGKYFADSKGEKELQYSEVFTISPHKVVYDEPVAATCTKTGLTAGSHCSSCGTKIVAQTVTEKINHTQMTLEAKNPTCLEDGYTEGIICSSCGKVFVKQNTIAATGHRDTDEDGVCDICDAELINAEDCSCNCHKTGFMGFIWIITRFFWKLFKINPVCECGVAHY